MAEEVKKHRLEQQAQMSAMRWEAGQVAWVLLMTHGKKLVTSRVKLGPDSRRLCATATAPLHALCPFPKLFERALCWGAWV